MTNFFLICTGVFLLIHAMLPRRTVRDRGIVRAAVLLLAIIAAKNTVHFYWLLGSARIESTFPLPFSIFVVAACLGPLERTGP